MQEKQKMLPVGIENFDEIRKEGFLQRRHEETT